MEHKCTAKSKTTGDRCRQSAEPGFTVCRFHGGKTPTGIAAPQFKNGRYSKHLPKRLLAQYEAAKEDSELLNSREEIALLNGRLNDLLSRVDKGEAGKLWEQAQKHLNQMLKDIHNENFGGILINATMLDKTIGEGLTDYAAWSEVRELLDTRRKLVEAEQKRLVSMEQMISSEQAMTLVSALLESVRRNVSDRDILSAIQAEFIRLVSADSRAELSS